MAVRKKTEIKYFLSLNNSKFSRALAASTTRLKAATKTFTRYSKSIGIAGSAASLAAAGGFYALNRALGETVRLANIQDAAEAKLAAVVKATGQAAGFTAAELNRYAGELQSVSIYGDEATISAMAVLASFKNIKGDQFKLATRAAQDMSTVMKTDLNSSILQIGKALNDPIKGLSALSRAGVQFTDAQRQQIKTMQESGNIMGAQKIILAELAGQFGGAAEAARNTFGGAMTAAGNALGDLKEQIGFAFTKNAALVEGIKATEQQFVSWTSKLKANEGQTQRWATNSAIAVLSFSSSAIEAAAGAMGVFATMSKTMMLAYTTTLRLASGALYYQKVIAGAKGDLAAVNRLHKERLNLQYDIEQAYENIMETDEAADKADQWAKNAAAKILALKKTIEETKIDPSETFDDADDKVGQKLVKVGDTWTNVTETSMAAVNDELEKGMDVSEETAKTAGKAILTDWKTFFDDMEGGTESAVSAIISQLERLQAAASSASAATSAATGYKTGGLASKFAAGGLAIQKFAAGGKLGGYGGGDRIPALLEAGEFIIRKESVAKYGASLFSALNKLRLPELPKFATGGPVMAGSEGGGENVTLHFSFPGIATQPKGSFGKADADAMVKLLKRQQRLSSS